MVSEDHQLFTKHYENNIGLALFVCQRHYRLDNATAQDLAQIAFIKAYEQYHQLTDKSKFKAWLMQIIKNEALMFIRQQKSRAQNPAQQLPQPSEEPSQAEGNTNTNEAELILITSFLEQLPAGEEKEIFCAFYQQGKSTKEIAALFSTPIITVTTKLSRMRQKIKRTLVEKIVALRENTL